MPSLTDEMSSHRTPAEVLEHLTSTLPRRREALQVVLDRRYYPEEQSPRKLSFGTEYTVSHQLHMGTSKNLGTIKVEYPRAPPQLCAPWLKKGVWVLTDVPRKKGPKKEAKEEEDSDSEWESPEEKARAAEERRQRRILAHEERKIAPFSHFLKTEGREKPVVNMESPIKKPKKKEVRKRREKLAVATQKMAYLSEESKKQLSPEEVGWISRAYGEGEKIATIQELDIWLSKLNIETNARPAEWQEELEELCNTGDFLTVQDILYIMEREKAAYVVDHGVLGETAAAFRALGGDSQGFGIPQSGDFNPDELTAICEIFELQVPVTEITEGRSMDFKTLTDFLEVQHTNRRESILRRQSVYSQRGSTSLGMFEFGESSRNSSVHDGDGHEHDAGMCPNCSSGNKHKCWHVLQVARAIRRMSRVASIGKPLDHNVMGVGVPPADRTLNRGPQSAADRLAQQRYAHYEQMELEYRALRKEIELWHKQKLISDVEHRVWTGKVGHLIKKLQQQVDKQWTDEPLAASLPSMGSTAALGSLKLLQAYTPERTLPQVFDKARHLPPAIRSKHPSPPRKVAPSPYDRPPAKRSYGVQPAAASGPMKLTPALQAIVKEMFQERSTPGQQGHTTTSAPAADKEPLAATLPIKSMSSARAHWRQIAASVQLVATVGYKTKFTTLWTQAKQPKAKILKLQQLQHMPQPPTQPSRQSSRNQKGDTTRRKQHTEEVEELRLTDTEELHLKEAMNLAKSLRQRLEVQV
uniref:Uncharacterized protein n=1 Tax=Eutreptiella gymnastica TaxID=73025 RepID=A0A7S1IZM7_9EUGL|mmetsp:Transcript_54548/g.96980  ORF Transcript_54548/g.96980 Transcript_54548/m.96980 type:complete len:753 (+) Transcript_54548:88-2346(+)